MCGHLMKRHVLIEMHEKATSKDDKNIIDQD